MESVDNIDEAPIAIKSEDNIAIHQTSNSPVYTTGFQRSSLSDPSLSIKQNNSSEFNTKAVLPPIHVTSKKKGFY